MFIRVLCIFLLGFCLPFSVYGQYSLIKITPESTTETSWDFGEITTSATKRFVVENTTPTLLTIRVSSGKFWLSSNFVLEPILKVRFPLQRSSLP